MLVGQDLFAQLVLDPTDILARALARGLASLGELLIEAGIQVRQLPRALLDLLHAVAQAGEPYVEGTQLRVGLRPLSFGIEKAVAPLLFLTEVDEGGAEGLDAPVTDDQGFLSTQVLQGFSLDMLGDPVQLLYFELELLVRGF